jgi:lysophospholipase L1-like esterase
MRRVWLGTLVIGCLLSGPGCRGDDGQESSGYGAPSGGSTSASGGSGGTATPTGGAPGAGGSVATGGVVSTGGVAATGGVGATPTGGVANTGGSSTTGGVAVTGGAPISGGTGGVSPASGGAVETGGIAPTGGFGPASGGATMAGGGATAEGGSPSDGGSPSGGAAGQEPGSGGEPSGGGAAPTGGSGGSSGYSPCPTNGDPCPILPFGDSITEGVQSSDQGGYRSKLFEKIVAANQKATFVGSLSNGPNQVAGQPFPKNHEGHRGWTIEPGYSAYDYGGISSLVPHPAFDTMPGIVLLMIGTNDITANSGQAQMPDRLEALLDKIVEAAPDALIVLATLTPVSWDPSTLSDYNAQIPGIVSARAAQGQHIISVDMGQMPHSDLASDSVHPNDQGYAYMADVWYAAIQDLLPN